MSIPFSADEAFEMAAQIERNGAEFYRKAAENVGEESTRKLLLDLAEWESTHEKTFAAMRAELKGEEKEATAFDPEGEAALYLRAMADGRVFDVKTDPASLLSGKESADEVLKTALGLEKDSILFYLGLRDMVPERLGRDKVEEIIKEEMGHIAFLNKQMSLLEK